jgi:hypothetical protein
VTVLTLDGERIAAITAFHDAKAPARFGLPGLSEPAVRRASPGESTARGAGRSPEADDAIRRLADWARAKLGL